MERNGERGFCLDDLRVETVLDGRSPVCRHVEAETFRVVGGNLVFDGPARLSTHALAVELPLLPARQCDTDVDNWMTSEAEVTGLDPHCGGRVRILHEGRHWPPQAATTGLPDQHYWKDDQ
jgi:hypothetical protein